MLSGWRKSIKIFMALVGWKLVGFMGKRKIEIFLRGKKVKGSPLKTKWSNRDHINFNLHWMINEQTQDNKKHGKILKTFAIIHVISSCSSLCRWFFILIKSFCFSRSVCYDFLLHFRQEKSYLDWANLSYGRTCGKNILKQHKPTSL